MFKAAVRDARPAAKATAKVTRTMRKYPQARRWVLSRDMSEVRSLNSELFVGVDIRISPGKRSPAVFEKKPARMLISVQGVHDDERSPAVNRDSVLRPKFKFHNSAQSGTSRESRISSRTSSACSIFLSVDENLEFTVIRCANTGLTSCLISSGSTKFRPSTRAHA